jgi:hypothetical protein
MQNIILNTRNLSVIEAPVNDIILIEDRNELDSETKLKIVGVELGKLKFNKTKIKIKLFQF